MVDATQYIDTDRYPLDKPGSDGFKAMIEAVRTDLRKDGCAVLKGFVKADAIAALVTEADRAAPFGHNSKSRTNAYFSQDDPSLDRSSNSNHSIENRDTECQSDKYLL